MIPVNTPASFAATGIPESRSNVATSTMRLLRWRLGRPPPRFSFFLIRPGQFRIDAVCEGCHLPTDCRQTFPTIGSSRGDVAKGQTAKPHLDIRGCVVDSFHEQSKRAL